MTSLDGLILALVALQAAATGWIFTRSLPVRLDRTIRDVAGLAMESSQAVKRLQDAWDQERAHLAAILEQMEDVAETIEKRRARITAQRQRIEQAEPATPEDHKMALRRRAGLS